MSDLLDLKTLKTYIDAFILYEIATHGVDPRDTLEGTTFRIKPEE